MLTDWLFCYCTSTQGTCYCQFGNFVLFSYLRSVASGIRTQNSLHVSPTIQFTAPLPGFLTLIRSYMFIFRILSLKHKYLCFIGKLPSLHRFRENILQGGRLCQKRPFILLRYVKTLNQPETLKVNKSQFVKYLNNSCTRLC